MVMDDRTKNINISSRSAMLCRHFSYVLHELYFIFFIIYLDTQRSKMRFLEKDILACCNTAFVYLQHRQSSMVLYSSTQKLHCCYSKALIISSQGEIHKDISTNTLPCKIFCTRKKLLLFVSFLMHTYTDGYIQTPLLP